MPNDILERNRVVDAGGVRINNNAITAIAAQAALEIRGVSKMGGGFGRTLLEFLRSGRALRGVRVKMRDGALKLVVYVVVEYGVNIPKVADEVQDNVKRILEKMTGLMISEVEVVIENVITPGSNGR